MKRTLTFLVLALALLAGAQTGLFTPSAAEAANCQEYCSGDVCQCCTLCCTLNGRYVCNQQPCYCP